MPRGVHISWSTYTLLLVSKIIHAFSVLYGHGIFYDCVASCCRRKKPFRHRVLVNLHHSKQQAFMAGCIIYLFIFDRTEEQQSYCFAVLMFYVPVKVPSVLVQSPLQVYFQLIDIQIGLKMLLFAACWPIALLFIMLYCVVSIQSMICR